MLTEICDLIRAREFHPFVITTDDGNARPVHHVERIMVGDKNVVLLATDDLIEIIPECTSARYRSFLPVRSIRNKGETD